MTAAPAGKLGKAHSFAPPRGQTRWDTARTGTRPPGGATKLDDD